ncbi:MAG: hypothetical protein ACRDY0_05105, partial [Acidimicrobiales bacterium]
SGSGARPVPVPGALLEGLGRQADLRALAPDPDYSVYLNAAWSPGVALFPAGALASATSGGPPAGSAEQQRAQRASLGGGRPVLEGASGGSGRGVIPTAGAVYVASTRSSRWVLHSGGRAVAPAPAFGWAMVFPAAAGPANLSVSAPLWGRAEAVVETIAWMALAGVVVADGGRRRRARRAARRLAGTGRGHGGGSGWRAAGAGSPARRPALVATRSKPPAAGYDDEEAWGDG